MREEIKKLERIGAVFQALLISAFLYRVWAFSSYNAPFMVETIGFAGATCFTYCLYTLYIRKGKVSGLITTGVFRYTRHPMYSGAVLMDVTHWFGSWGTDFVISSAIFYGALILAAFIQERETLSRFGTAAEAYYQRTPRLAVFYPFIRSAE